MNDRYLFKAKTCNGEWITGLLAHKDNKYYISNKAGMPFAFEVRPDTICQCTGLKDKNGTLIWENDVASATRENGIVEYAVIECHTSSTMSGFRMSPLRDWRFTPFNEIEVIGNIFDNPELLEVEHDGE